MLTPSAHTDTFCRDNLPPQAQWPEFASELPALQYPARLNIATALWFHRPFTFDDWLLYVQDAVADDAGRGVGTGRFFTREGPPHRYRSAGRHDSPALSALRHGHQT
ncbi:hypothetical protein OG874_16300 [Nocardia sp. NBC_00565]|uniref:hypothetical protein n=1 Tax=Nocardia sp. NBC_00565 TaxID=2975993 RepID=UPI002E806CB2|nr:hypothetical protein [Nocardia sp. NBC_00565]WUC06581.1 hypothetical protein OG874_16300 [Nocardia sp. NBC_00565]